MSGRDESLPLRDVSTGEIAQAKERARALDLDALLAEADAAADPAVPLDRLAHGGALIRRLADALRKERDGHAATLRMSAATSHSLLKARFRQIELHERLEAERAEVERLRGIARDCPLGWHAGRVITHRGTSDADVVKWLQRLNEAAGTPFAQRCICERRARENTDEDCPEHGQDGGWPVPERPAGTLASLPADGSDR